MFRETIAMGRPFGIRVDVSLSWLIICAVVTWSLGAFYFPTRFPLWPSSLVWLAASLCCAAFFASVVAHELAHALVATKLGVQVRGISLFLFGGVTQFKGEASSPAVELAIALVGPGLNLALGLGSLAAYFLLVDIPQLVSAVSLWSGALNLALGLFNLLPWLPLDGGRVLRALAWYASDDRRWANRVTLLAGQLGSAALIFAGVSMIVTQHGGLANAVWVMLVGWFVHSSSVASYQTNSLLAVLGGARVDQLMVHRLGRVERDSTEGQSPAARIGSWGPEFYVVTHEGRDVGVLSISVLREPKSEVGHDPNVLDAMVPVQQDLVLDVSGTAMDALQIFIDRDLQWVPVVREGEVVGVIRRLDLAEYVEKHRRS